jgi:hypothetical protein
MFGKYANDSWSENGNSCMIKWSPNLRRAEIWSLVDIPLYKKLGVAYNDSYWYRIANEPRTILQALQVKELCNKAHLPPYEDSLSQHIAQCNEAHRHYQGPQCEAASRVSALQGDDQQILPAQTTAALETASSANQISDSNRTIPLKYEDLSHLLDKTTPFVCIENLSDAAQANVTL